MNLVLPFCPLHFVCGVQRSGLCAGRQTPDQRSSPVQIAQWSVAGRALVHTSAIPPTQIAQWCAAGGAPIYALVVQCLCIFCLCAGRAPVVQRKLSNAQSNFWHFTSPEAWSKAAPVLLDREISRLAAVAVLPLSSRDRSFLLDEEKMISEGIFARLHARLPRLCDFDTVCDLQARAVKNSKAASKRHAAGLAKKGIAGPDGDDPSYGEDAGDVTGGGVESGQPPMRAEAAATVPVAAVATVPVAAATTVPVAAAAATIPIAAADATTPTATTPNRKGTEEPAVAETLSTQLAVREGPAEVENVAVPSSEGVNEQTIPASTSPSPRPASPSVAMGEPNISNQPRPSGQPESTDRPGPSKQPGTSASGSGFSHEAPLVGPVEADEGNMSLFDFSATEICSHLVNNDIYIGDSWGHVKDKSCNKKMEFFFNCHSLMMSKLGENYKYGIRASSEIKRLREQASVLAAEKLSAEESHAQQLAQFRESSNGHLSARLAAEEKLSAAEEEIRSLKELLSMSQESFAARLEAERVAEEAKEKVEHEAADLRNQLSSRDLIFDNLKAVPEAESVDRFKRSPAYDALLLREFEKGMRQAKKFFAMKDHSNEKALKRFDRSLQQHMASGVDSIKDQIKRWKAHCRYNRTEPHPMHLEIPSKRAFNTYYSGQKGSFSGSSAEPDLGPVAGRDYEPFMPMKDEEVIWPSDEEIEDEEDSEGPPAAG
ncbi:hypothetical protein LWI29_031272 [Acer saccharum]|uniref:Uncharacterized protein n=1 Tax=Acer saccharum TaxID=4024 RepID=A0AA39VPG2_ACESA|nr:hypothetical protein LWI29_031272 [Acer saccharum]